MKQLPSVRGFLSAAASLAIAAGLYAGYRAVPGFAPFVLHTICVEGTQRSSSDAIIAAAGAQTGSGLLQLDMERVRAGVEGLPWVRHARVVRQMPGTLRISVEEWQPAFLARLQELRYVTRSGHVIPAALEHGLDYPVITGLDRRELERDGPIRSALLELLDVLEVGLLEDEVSEIHCSPASGITVYTPSAGGAGIHLGWSPYAEKLEHLARLQRHLDRHRQSAYAVNLIHPDRIIARLTPASAESRQP